MIKIIEIATATAIVVLLMIIKKTRSLIAEIIEFRPNTTKKIITGPETKEEIVEEVVAMRTIIEILVDIRILMWKVTEATNSKEEELILITNKI